MFRRKTASATYKPAPPLEPEINVTPLVDVVLVLLIIFMVIAPNLQEGTPVLLPEVQATDDKAKTEGTEVVLAADGTLYLDDTALERDQLMAALQVLLKEQPDKPLVVKADATLPYGDVRNVFASVQRLGFRNVSMKVAARKPEAT
jgi:biopolymer transport protein TolR